LVKIEAVIAGFGGFYFFIPYGSIIIDGLDDDAFVQNSGPFAHIKKCIGLFIGNNFMKPVTEFDLPVIIVFLTDFDDEIICFFVFVADKIELI
jgi:hypothetical protein